MICPNFNIKEVFDGFNEIIQTFGGKPMTEEEFKSSELRNRRTGLDYSAMEAAYKIYHENGGNFLDFAPNGEESILFQNLMQHFGGDRKSAIRAKSQIYSKKFKEQFGDWINGSVVGDNKLDYNGEPQLADVVTIENEPVDSNELYDQFHLDESFAKADVRKLFGDSVADQLFSGNKVSSKDIFNQSSINVVSPNFSVLSKILKKHDIPVRLEPLKNGKIFVTVVDENGNAVILIDPTRLEKVSANFFMDGFLHEMVHALTVKAIQNPKTEEEKRLQRNTSKIFRTLEKVFENYNIQDYDSLYYFLNNSREFVAEFLTNQDVRDVVYRAIYEQQKQNGSIFIQFKNFVNAITRFFINKNLFYTEESELKLLEKQFYKYMLNSVGRLDQNVSRSQLMQVVYSKLDNVLLNGEFAQVHRSVLSEMVDRMEQNPYKLLQTNDLDLNKDPQQILKEMSVNIADALAKRLSAVKVSNLPPDQKNQIKQTLEDQISQFRSDQINDFTTISNFLLQVSPQLLEDSKRVRSIRDNKLSFSDAEYMYQRHDNFGVYENILRTITNILSMPSIKTELLHQIEEDPNSSDTSLDDITRLYNIAQNCQSMATEAVVVTKNILLNNISDSLSQIAHDTNDSDLIDYLNQLERIGFDTSWMLKNLGSASRAKDKGLQVLSHLINRAIAKTDIDTHYKTVDLQKLQDALQYGESVLDLYEYDEDGKTTQYLVRSRNYGVFFRDYKEEIKKINQHISTKYNLDLDPENRVAPEDNEDARNEWNKLKNDWLDKNADRKYIRRYYDAQAMLSSNTRAHRDAIQIQIREIKKKALGSDGNYHYNKLSQQDYDILNGLYMQKRQLASDYDLMGQLKTPGTEEYKIAKELQAFNKEIYKDGDIAYDIESWKSDREFVIQQAGGRSEYEKGRSNDKFDWKMLDKWDSRNSKRVLKKDKEGNVLLFKRIQEEMTQEMPVYENEQHDGGAEYENNQKKLSDLKATYRDYNTGDIIPSKIPAAVQSEIIRLEKRQAQLKKLNRKNKKVQKARKEYASIFQKYAKYEWTELYKRLYSQAQYEDVEHPGYLQNFMRKTGKFIVHFDPMSDSIDDSAIEFRPYSWYTKLAVKVDEFEELMPGDGYINTDTDKQWLNPEFDESEQQSIVPKLYKDGIKTKYNNEEAYKKVANNPRLNALYEKIIEVMHESNSEYTNKEFKDDYLLPSITGTMYKICKNQKSPWKAAKNYVSQNFGITEDDIQYGASIEDALSSQDQFGRFVENSVNSVIRDFGGKTSILRPDGRELGMIPQNYTRRLRDTSQLSADLVGIVLEYYNKAKKFKYRNEIKDTCEAIVDMMEDRQYATAASGRSSNTWQMARKFLDTNLYDIKNNRSEITISGKKISFTKLGQIIRWGTTLINLGFNIAVAGTGMLTTWYSHLIASLTGQHYDFFTASKAGVEVLWRVTKNYFGAKYIGNKTSKDKLMVLMEYYNVSDQGDRKRRALNRMKLVDSAMKVLDPFSMLSAGDFFMKSQIAVSVLMSYRLFNNEFVTEEDVKNMMWNKSKEDVEEAINQWRDGIVLYSILDQKDGKFHVDEKYKNQYEKVDSVVKARMLNYGANADGMATETQRAAITTTFLGACILIHRQYLPLLLQERFGHTVWDEDMQQFTGGEFRIIAQITKALMYDQFKDSSRRNISTLGKVGMLGTLGAGIGSIIPGVGMLGAGAFGVSLGLYLMRNSSVFGGILNTDKTDMQEQLKANYNQHALRKVMMELGMYNLVIKPLVLMLIKMSKDDDKKDKRLLQLVTYIMTRFMWESYTPYRFDDMINNVKSPSAALSTVDKLEDMGYQLYKTAMPQGSLLDTFVDDKPFSLFKSETVSRGPYKNWTKFERSLMKATPMHNAYEQWLDSKNKENYYINQVMKLDLDE